MYLKQLRPHHFHEAVARGWPLLVPAGCIETHGPHMELGHDTILSRRSSSDSPRGQTA